MNNRGLLSETWSSSRVNLHGQVTDLSAGFALDGKPFSVFVVSKSGETGETLLLDVKLIGDYFASPCPVVTGDWCPLSIVEITGASASLLNDYDIYWGRGY